MKKNKIIIISMLLMGLALFVNLDEAAADASVIYVNATGGNDNWNGQSQFYVNGTTGPKKTINGGTTAVLANGTVNIADGTYSGTGNWGITLTKNMTIQGQSQNNTIIDGSGSRQIFVINSGVNVTMINLTIRNAQANDNNGGAIRNNGGILTVNNCKFTGNSAVRTGRRDFTPVYGGAIYSTGNLNISNSFFLNNWVLSGADNDAQGGAIYSSGPLTITDSTFFNNTATSSSGTQNDDGGAIAVFNTLKITRSTFTNNRAGNVYGGGAIMIGDNNINVADVEITESTFINNTAGYGGAIWMNAGTSTKAALISKSTFMGNSATGGGAIRNWGFLNVTGSNFINNSATQGGAIFNYMGTANINFNRIMGNTGNMEIYYNSGIVNANNNWWGSNTSPSSKVSTQVNVSNWLVLNINAVPNSILTGNNSIITADLTRNQNGVYFDPANGHVPDGIVVTFTGTRGSIAPNGVMAMGSVSQTFTAGYTPGVAQVTAATDGVSVNTTLNINPVARIQITQTVNTPVNVKDQVNFVVTVKNNGPNTATNIVIRDLVPVNLTNAVVTPSVGTYNPNTGLWTIPTLLNGSSATLSISGVSSILMAGKTINNTATQISQNEYTPELASSTAGVYTKMADIQMSQTGNTPVNVGDGVTYIVTILNIGPDHATNFIIENKIPAGLLNVVVTPSTGSYLNGNWTVPFLANGDSATLTITGIASADMAGKNTTNTATKIFETEYDPTTIGESVSYDVYTKKANVVLSQTGNYVKDVVTFLVTATNNGPDAATNINIKNLIPAGLTNVLVTPNVGTYDISTGIWTIPSLSVGQIATLKINGTAMPQSTIKNELYISSQREYGFEDDSSINRVYVPVLDLAVRNYEWFFGRSDTYNFNEAPAYVSYVRNYGPDDATNIVVRYAIGGGLVYEGNLLWYGVDRAEFDGQNLTYYVDYLPSGGTAAIIVYLRVNDVGARTANLTTRASLVSVDQNESGTYPNSETRRLTVAQAADIEVTQNEIEYDSLNKKATITINVKNNGPNNASGVKIKDLLPSGFSYTGHSSGENYDPLTGIWDIGILNNQAVKTLQIFVDVIATSGNIINTATLNSTTLHDWNTANNAYNANITVTGSYTPRVDLAVRNYEWFFGRGDTYNFNEAPAYVSYVRNYGPDDATNIVVRYVIGGGLVYEGNLLWYGVDRAEFDGQNLTYYVDYLPSGGTAAIIVYLRVNDVGARTANLTTRASLVSVDQNESGTYPNSETRRLTVTPASNIKVTQTIDGSKSGKGTVGEDITISLTVKNNGPSANSNIIINTALGGLTYIQNDGDATYDETSGNVTWIIDNLNSGESKTIHITVKADQAGTYTISSHKKSASTAYDWNMASNSQKSKLIINERKGKPI
ncbi:DUF11 domain-containing protein [Methanobacterium alkalithermotolerans]|uniref:DUF11 domain-containing protein n=1 Tax=Methanobacterium alkalithermotolerans TaxID=2731220 RepID=A0A8T8K651_9EURY|nr:DUF11 domain-containing protein [Methanobacterium alkalithermotolerans]QUH22613.1 DUF11 domain-containing protein [Methanobacterium alkalithermotolerans]